MKKLIILGMMLFVTAAHADTDDVLNECRVTCSDRCKTYAESILDKAQEVLDCKGGSSSNSEVIQACVNGFGNGSAGQTCSRDARSAETVKVCVAGFGNGSSGLTCATSNADDEVVSACVSGFGNGNSGLTCATNARDAKTVRTCVSSFGNGSAGLNCAIGK